MKTIVGPFTETSYTVRRERLSAMRHESDTAREFFLVVRMFDRVADPEKIVDMGKERNRLAFRVNDLSNELRASDSKVRDLDWKMQRLNEELARYRALHGELPVVEAFQNEGKRHAVEGTRV